MNGRTSRANSANGVWALRWSAATLAIARRGQDTGANIFIRLLTSRAVHMNEIVSAQGQAAGKPGPFEPHLMRGHPVRSSGSKSKFCPPVLCSNRGRISGWTCSAAMRRSTRRSGTAGPSIAVGIASIQGANLTRTCCCPAVSLLREVGSYAAGGGGASTIAGVMSAFRMARFRTRRASLSLRNRPYRALSPF
jgi:hypothetical protein